MRYFYSILIFLSLHNQQYASDHIMIDTTPIDKYLECIPTCPPASHVRHIDAVYVINLKERPEKWKRMKKILRKQNIRALRFGINGWNIPKEILDEVSGTYPPLRGGEIGCLLSHLSVMKDAYKRKFKRIWILEDDVLFKKSVGAVEKSIQKLLKKDPEFDVLYTDSEYRKNNHEYTQSLDIFIRPNQTLPHPHSYYLEKIPLDKDIQITRQRFGFHSVILSRSGIKKILDYFTHVYIWSAIDIDIHFIPNLKQYVTRKELVTNSPDALSDTSDTSSLKRARNRENLQ